MRAKYVGAGEFHSGIPRRDLTADDWAALDAARQALVMASPLYETEPPPIGRKTTLPGVGPEIAQALYHAGYTTLDAIAAATEEDLLAISGIGPGRLKQIREALSALKDGE